MHTLVMDVRFAFRTMSKNARVTILAALTLALGIGARVVPRSQLKVSGDSSMTTLADLPLSNNVFAPGELGELGF